MGAVEAGDHEEGGAELRRAPGIFLAPILTGAATVVYPFVIAIVVPYFAGERLSDSSDFEVALEMYRTLPASRDLSPEGAVQAMIFQFALTLMVGLTTVTGGMSIAAHSINVDFRGWCMCQPRLPL